MDSYKRETRYKCSVIFNESVKDTFDIKLLDNETTDWYQLEPNEKMDSLVFWISDTTVAKLDTLFMEFSYYMLDSAAQLYVQKDTLEMNFKDVVVEKSRKRKKSKEDETVCENKYGVVESTFDINLILTTEELNC